jgi:hypothetical protein
VADIAVLGGCNMRCGFSPGIDLIVTGLTICDTRRVNIGRRNPHSGGMAHIALGGRDDVFCRYAGRRYAMTVSAPP